MKAYRDTKYGQTVLVEKARKDKIEFFEKQVSALDRWVEISVEEAMRTPNPVRNLRKFVVGSNSAQPVTVGDEVVAELEESSNQAELENYTMDELRELAADLEIKGRSKMDKQELVEAIAPHMGGSS